MTLKVFDVILIGIHTEVCRVSFGISHSNVFHWDDSLFIWNIDLGLLEVTTNILSSVKCRNCISNGIGLTFIHWSHASKGNGLLCRHELVWRASRTSKHIALKVFNILPLPCFFWNTILFHKLNKLLFELVSVSTLSGIAHPLIQETQPAGLVVIKPTNLCALELCRFSRIKFSLSLGALLAALCSLTNIVCTDSTIHIGLVILHSCK